MSAHFFSISLCFCCSPPFSLPLLPNSVSVFGRSLCLDQSSMESCPSNESRYVGQDFVFSVFCCSHEICSVNPSVVLHSL